MKPKKSGISFKKIKTVLSVLLFVVGTCVSLGIAYGGVIMVKFDRLVTKLDKAATIYLKEHEEKTATIDADSTI